jgi:hydroxyacylglutathione hydrolase
MFVEHYLIVEVNETNVYLVACPTTRQACLIDAGGFDPNVVETARANNLEVRSVLITHDHYDHTGSLSEYLDAFPECEIVAGGARAGGRAATAASDGLELRVGELRARVLAIGGHTPDSVAYYFTAADPPASSALFSGDALFAGSVGGAHGAAHDQEIDAIRRKIFVLPESTPVYPGHGPATTVGVEKHANPFF